MQKSLSRKIQLSLLPHHYQFSQIVLSIHPLFSNFLPHLIHLAKNSFSLQEYDQLFYIMVLFSLNNENKLLNQLIQTSFDPDPLLLPYELQPLLEFAAQISSHFFSEYRPSPHILILSMLESLHPSHKPYCGPYNGIATMPLVHTFHWLRRK